MLGLKEKLAQQIPGLREDIRKLHREHGETVLSQVTVSQAFGGMRGVKGLVCDTSVVDPDQGLAVRGIPIGDLADRLPEEVFYLLCTGDCRMRKHWPRSRPNSASAPMFPLTSGTCWKRCPKTPIP